MRNAIAILVALTLCLVGCSSEKPLALTELKGVKVALKSRKERRLPILHAQTALAELQEGGATLTTPERADLVIEQDYDRLGHSVVQITSGRAIVFYEDYAVGGGSYLVRDDIRKFARENGQQFREEAQHGR